MRGDRVSWMKQGCLGCGAVVLVVAVVAVVLVVLAAESRRGEPVPEHPRLVHALPPLPAEAVPPERGSLPGVELPEAVTPTPLEVWLDLSLGSFRVEAGPAGEPVRVSADYDSRRFALHESFDPASRTYRVHFRGRRPMILVGEVRGDDARLRLVLPKGYPIALHGRVRLGESRLELGGLWLTDVDLDLGAGEHRVRFDAPLAAPLGRLAIDGSLGEVVLGGLGNASPRRLVLHHGMGELDLDLRGGWANDARISVDFGMGDCTLRLPEHAAVRLERARVGIGGRRIELPHREPVPGEPTLTLSIKGGVGQIDVAR